MRKKVVPPPLRRLRTSQPAGGLSLRKQVTALPSGASLQRRVFPQTGHGVLAVTSGHLFAFDVAMRGFLLETKG